MLDQSKIAVAPKELLNPRPKQEDILCQYCHTSGQPLITIYCRTNDLMQSYITTGGVPFLPFTTVTKEMRLVPPAFISDLGTGIVVDIAPGMYQPVQSRTHLKMRDSDIQHLRRMLLDALYIYTIHKGVSDPAVFNRIFTHFDSKVSKLDQLELSESQNKEFQEMLSQFIATGTSLQAIYPEFFFTNYEPICIPGHQTHKSFFDHITAAMSHFTYLLSHLKQEVLTKIVQRIEEIKQRLAGGSSPQKDRAELEQFIRETQEKMDGYIKDILRTWHNQIIAENNVPSDLILNVVIPWIEKKVTHFKIDNLKLESSLDEIPALKNKKEQEDEIKGKQFYDKIFPHLKELRQALDAFLECYCEAYQKCLGAIPLHLSKIGWVGSGSLDGTYSDVQKNIEINISKISIGELLNLMEKIREGETANIQRNPVYNNLFGTLPGSIGTVIHELEHARRGSDDNVHGPSTDADGSAGVSFDACATSYARKAIEAGLILQWAERFSKQIKDIYIGYSLTSAIEDLEKENKKLLIKALFEETP
jgi:hypothetical protein